MSVIAVWIPVCVSVKYLSIWINIYERPAVWTWDILQWIRLFNRTWKQVQISLTYPKILPEQKISCCEGIYISNTTHTQGIYKTKYKNEHGFCDRSNVHYF